MVYAMAFAAFLAFPAFLQGQTLTLNEAIHLAEAHNRSLQIAQLDRRKAADEASVARTYHFPSFSLTALGSQPFAHLGLTLPQGSLATFPNVGPIPRKNTTLQGPLKRSGIFIANATQQLSQQ